MFRFAGVLGLGMGLGLGCAPPAPPLGNGFVFGTSTAGFQVEMGCPTLSAAQCDDPQSDWYAFITSTEPEIQARLSGDLPSSAPGHWELYEQDLDRVAAMGLQGFRMSLEWSRIFPSPTDGIEGQVALREVASPSALAHYHAVFAALRARGITPWVTVNHYTLPLWIHDAIACHNDFSTCTRRGWVDRERTVREIAKFAGFVAQEFGGEVDHWATLNEPISVLVSGYLMPNTERTNPPARLLSFTEGKIVFGALVEAHARMYDAIKSNDVADADGDGKANETGVVFAFTPARAADESRSLDVRAAQDVFYLWNEAYLNAVVKGDLDEDLDGTAEHQDSLAGRMDWMGINYYTRVTVEGTGTPSFPSFSARTRFNPLTLKIWEDYPRGIYDMVMYANAWGLPMVITENGKADPLDDGAGSDFLVRHLTWVERARKAGADVRGYFWWTLMDNYEWNHGMDIRMGLFAVSEDDPLKTRTPRKTVATYSEIVQAQRVPPALLEKYPEPESADGQQK